MQARFRRRNASLRVVIVAPRMTLARGVSPTLVPIRIDGHTAIQRMAGAASQRHAGHMPLIGFDHFPR